MDGQTQARLKQLPKVDALLSDGACQSLIDLHGRPLVVDAIRDILAEIRMELRDNHAATLPDAHTIIQRAEDHLNRHARTSLRRVVNATGIVLHTNLGRAPLADEALQAIREVGEGYSNLEYDLTAGARGSRQSHVDTLLCRLTGAEAALVVNNNAAAVMLAVNTVARDGEVVTSRGELIEIGGSFRIPEVIETSDARLVETGTTNRTRTADFAHAITPFTRVLLKVHPSNYRIVGFTESASRDELVALARERGLVAIEDLGSGTLLDLTVYGLPPEPTVQQAVTAGVDLVTFSGDKLLGGPQAGIVVGRADLIARMKQNPLYRALRVDKATLAALECTIRMYLDPDRIPKRLPVVRMLAQTKETLEARARRVVDAIASEGSIEAKVVSAEAFAGGGSLPEEAIADVAVTVRVAETTADALHAALRNGDPAVVARIADGLVRLHMRTVSDDDVPRIEAAFSRLKP